MATREELAWAAGFFDGEGSFTVARQKNGRIYPHAQIGQVDPRVLRKFHAIVGVGRVAGPYARKSPRHQPFWLYQAQGYEAFQHVFASLWPWLSEVKREQAAGVVAECRPTWSTVHRYNRSRTHCGKGHLFTEESLRYKEGTKTRVCRICVREHEAKRRERRRLAKLDEISGLIKNGVR